MLLDVVVAICNIKGMNPLKSYVEQRSPAPMRETAELLGLSRPYLYDLIKDRREPTLVVAKQIADATNGEVPIGAWPKFAAVAKAMQAGAA